MHNFVTIMATIMVKFFAYVKHDYKLIVIKTNHVYIGETFRALRIRLNEHQSHINQELGKSSIADHPLHDIT